MSRKWAASPDEHTVTSAKKKSRISGPAAVSDVASALHEMASSFNDADSRGVPLDPSTPQHWSKAIRTVENDPELNGNERIKAMRLFKHDIAAADLYLAINNSAMHAEVIRLEIEDI